MIIIRQMYEHEKVEVADLVGNAMRKEYHCDAHALPKVIFVGVRFWELVGAIGLSMNDEEIFSIEEIYQLDYRSFPEVFDRKCVVQLGRWVANAPDLSEALIYAAVSYALRSGCKWGMGEIKPKVARRFAQMGIRPFPFVGEPVLARIPIGVRPYYLLPPAPSVWVISLTEAKKALQKKVATLVSQSKIVIQYSK